MTTKIKRLIARKGLVILTLLLLALISSASWAEEYDATITTNSGSYSVPVEVEDGEVTEVHWPNGGNMTVSGAEIEDGAASGTNSRGDSVDIELDDYNSGENE